MKEIFNLETNETYKEEALDLAIRLLHFNPEKRPSAKEALADPYFTNFHDTKTEVNRSDSNTI